MVIHYLTLTNFSLYTSQFTMCMWVHTVYKSVWVCNDDSLYERKSKKRVIAHELSAAKRKCEVKKCKRRDAHRSVARAAAAAWCSLQQHTRVRPARRTGFSRDRIGFSSRALYTHIYLYIYASTKRLSIYFICSGSCSFFSWSSLSLLSSLLFSLHLHLDLHQHQHLDLHI